VVRLHPAPWKLSLSFAVSLRDADLLVSVLDGFVSAGFPITRIDDVEPIRRPYSHQTVRDILAPWGIEDPPCRVLVGFSRTTSLSVGGCYLSDDGDGMTNVVTLVSRPEKVGDIQKMRQIAMGYLNRGMLLWAGVDRESVFRSQHMPGSIYNRSPGVFWFNAFSPDVIDALGGDALDRVSSSGRSRRSGGETRAGTK